MIDIKGICYGYASNNQPTIRNISFAIKKGECVGLTGPSGCGKSTLASIIAGHIVPDKGTVSIDGKNVTGVPSRDVFLIHQGNDLFPWQRVERQVSFALGEKDLSKINELLFLTKLNGFERYYPNELSGGMKRRLAIARALAINPKLLILDESFSFLDSNLKNNLYADLKDIWRVTKTTILLITHDSDDLKNLAQREVRMTPEKPSTVLDIRDV